MTERTKPLVILEGPDGAGKTTLAKQLVKDLNARYVHLGPMQRVTKRLGRFYQEAMMPALQGYQAVVMDRAWFSEEPYGTVFRAGQPLRNDRVDDAMLERIAHRCPVVVIYCDVGEDHLRDSFLSRKGDEYLDRVDQVLAVARSYRERMKRTSLPVVHYDYTANSYEHMLGFIETRFLKMSGMRTHWRAHSSAVHSAGSLGAKFLLIGDEFTAHAPDDMLQQYPFVTFSGIGCSRWLTEQLLAAGIGENALAWINQDQGYDNLVEIAAMMPNLEWVVPLGGEARLQLGLIDRLLNGSGGDAVVDHEAKTFKHPQSHKRFAFSEPYPLIKYIKDRQ